MREKLKRGDIMSMIPFENYNTVITGNSLNEIMIDIINPLGYLANFAVQVIAPTFPSIPAVDEEVMQRFDLMVRNTSTIIIA
jgi:hypothetical protein